MKCAKILVLILFGLLFFETSLFGQATPPTVGLINERQEVSGVETVFYDMATDKLKVGGFLTLTLPAEEDNDQTVQIKTRWDGDEWETSDLTVTGAGKFSAFNLLTDPEETAGDAECRTFQVEVYHEGVKTEDTTSCLTCDRQQIPLGFS